MKKYIDKLTKFQKEVLGVVITSLVVIISLFVEQTPNKFDDMAKNFSVEILCKNAKEANMTIGGCEEILEGKDLPAVSITDDVLNTSPRSLHEKLEQLELLKELI